MHRRMGWVALLFALALVGAACGGGGDDGDGGSSSGGGGGGGGPETLPMDSDERCEGVTGNIGPDGAEVDEETAVPGCVGSPAPAGTTFTTTRADITYVSGTVGSQPSSDALNDTTFTITAVIEIESKGDGTVSSRDYQIVGSTPGDRIEDCVAEPWEEEIPSGESLEVTWTCSIDLMTDGSEVDLSTFRATLEDQFLDDSAQLELDAA